MSATNSFAIPSQLSLKDQARHVFARLTAARTLHAERARVRFELAQYSDRELADMGMSRADIDDVVASVRSASILAV